MKIKNQALILLTALGLFACTSQRLAIKPQLSHESEEMAVDGRNGWRIGQILSYGEFTTSKVKRGWIRSYDYDFYLKFRGAKQKMSFTQFNGVNHKAQVSTMAELNSQEISLLSDFLNIELDGEDYFAGDIAIEEDSHWSFIVYNPDGDLQNKTSGYLTDGPSLIEINGIDKVEGQASWVPMGNLGYEFIKDGEVVGAISTFDPKGKVWLSTTIDDETRLLISSVASALLLRDALNTVG